jgi:hypothetical protein
MKIKTTVDNPSTRDYNDNQKGRCHYGNNR